MPFFLSRFLICLALFVALPVAASDNDPPGRVGRISLAGEGTLLRIGDSNASGGATLNWPLTTGAVIETASGARSEARIGSTSLRIDADTVLEFIELNDERIWLRLNRGSVAITVQNPEHAAEMALDTPQGRLRFDSPGSYRADVAGGTTAFSAYQGSASIEEFGLALRSGERILLLGGSERSYLLGQAAHDTFRQWTLARERNDARPATRYVSPEMTGHEALDQHGSWRETAEYGAAWFPGGVPDGWAPYRWGRWAWVPPWGWTWVDQAPWGFAPFHYGRWAHIGGQWAWLPGAYVARPVYAPALVVWLGQPGWNLSVSIGTAPSVGWYPLGPREVYYPHYRSSLRHVRNINSNHVRHVDHIVTTTSPAHGHDRQHIHRQRHEAVTVAPQRAVQSGMRLDRPAAVPVGRRMVSVPTASPPPSVPQRHSEQRQPAATAVSARPAQPSAEVAASPRIEVQHRTGPPGAAGGVSATQPAQPAPIPPAAPVRRAEVPRHEPGPAMQAPRPHRAEAVSAAPPNAAPAIAAPQRHGAAEAGRDPAQRIERHRHGREGENKREADRGEQTRTRRGPQDR